MAQKRMFDKSVTRSDNFLEMPDSTQNLYFHLSMEADDDGFVDNWKSIMRMTGKKEDDLKLLVAKSFILPFDTGVIVIKHWRINNYLRKDRYNETKHLEEKAQLIVEPNQTYSLKSKSGIPSVTPDKNRIEKNSIDYIYCPNGQPKSELESSPNGQLKPKCELDFELFWLRYPRKEKKKATLNWFKSKKYKESMFEEIMNGLENQLENKKSCLNRDKQYIPLPTTWLNGEQWKDEYDIEENPFDKVIRELEQENQ